MPCIRSLSSAFILNPFSHRVKGEEMNKICKLMAVVLMAFAVVFTCSSCTRKEGASKSTAQKYALKLTPEQSKQAEEIKKGVKESKHIVIATVNGADLTMFDLLREMNSVAPKIIPNGLKGTPELTARVKKEALNTLIFKELAVQEAIKEGMRVEPEVVEDVINRVKAQAGSEEAYKNYLEERNINEDALKKTVERSRLLEMITAKEIFDKIKVDDNVLRNAYEKDKASFITNDNPARQKSFEEAKGFIEDKIKSEIGEKRIAQWNNKLRKKAKIEDILDEVEKKPKENAGIKG
jgi:hypothetical protein